MKHRPSPLLLLVVLLFAGCGAEAPADTTVATMTAAGQPPAATVAAAAPTLAPATVAAPVESSPGAATASPAGAPVEVSYGRNDNGTFFYGAAGAPLTLTDYSDFL